MKARWGGVVFVGSCAHDIHIPTEYESEMGWGRALRDDTLLELELRVASNKS